MHHRLCCCPASRSIRDTFKDQAILGRAQSAAHCNKPLFRYGIPTRLAATATPKAVTRWCGGRPPPGEFAVTGVGFTDGAIRGGPPACARRAGWSAILVNNDGEIMHGLYGICPDEFPTSLRAELWRLLKMLEMAIPPLCIWIDNQGVIDGWHKGRILCTAAARPTADL